MGPFGVNVRSHIIHMGCHFGVRRENVGMSETVTCSAKGGILIE